METTFQSASSESVCLEIIDRMWGAGSPEINPSRARLRPLLHNVE